MKATFILGFLLAFGGLLCGAYFYPIVNPDRVNSITSVALNGGRVESFLIRLPADRISALGDGTSGVRGRALPEGIELPESFRASGLLIEHFKLRNVEGVVIGLASRHWTFGQTGPETVWALSLPGRGAVALAGPGELPLSIDAALGSQGYVPDRSWDGEMDVQLVENENQTRVVSGSGEFANSDGTYTESWMLTGVTDKGEMRGTIEIATRISRSQ